MYCLGFAHCTLTLRMGALSSSMQLSLIPAYDIVVRIVMIRGPPSDDDPDDADGDARNGHHPPFAVVISFLRIHYQSKWSCHSGTQQLISTPALIVQHHIALSKLIRYWSAGPKASWTSSPTDTFLVILGACSPTRIRRQGASLNTAKNQ